MVLSISSPVMRVAKRAYRYPEYATLVRWFNMSWLIYAMAVMIVLVILHYGWHVACDVYELKQLRWISVNEGEAK